MISLQKRLSRSVSFLKEFDVEICCSKGILLLNTVPNIWRATILEGLVDFLSTFKITTGSHIS